MTLSPQIWPNDATTEQLRVTRFTLYMNDSNWKSLSSAGDHLDVSCDTILRRAIPWSDESVPGRIRFKMLKLGTDTRQARRYYVPDLDAMLVTA